MANDTQDQLGFGPNRTFINAMQKVANEGAAKMVELPMLIGAVMPLGGNAQPKETLHDRQLVQVTKQTFDRFMGQIAPQLEVEVDDKLSDKPDAKRKVKMTLTGMTDFDPARVAAVVPELAALLQIRRRLEQLTANLGGKPATERQLAEVLADLKKALPDKR